MDDCKWRIGRGTNICLKSKLWIPPDRDIAGVETVNQLFDANGNWDENLVKLCYDEPKVTKILNTPISKTGILDRIVWTKLRDGKYNVKKE